MTFLATPREWWDHLDDEIGFTLDAAADHQHFMCVPYFTEEQDALSQKWIGRVWCSPPWKEENLGLWVEKGFTEAKNGNAEVVVMLLPVRSDSDWWHEYAIKADEIRFLYGPLKFVPYDPDIITFNVEPHCLVFFFQPHLPMNEWGTVLRSYAS